MEYRMTDAPTLAETDEILSFAYGGRKGIAHFLLRLAYFRETEPFFYALARDKEWLAGFLLCQKRQDGWYYGDLLVHPDYRRQGIGNALLEETAREAARRGGSRLCCFVAPDNLPSRQLQRSAGFSEDAAPPGAPGLLFVRPLLPAGSPAPIERPGRTEERPARESDAWFVQTILASAGHPVSWQTARRLTLRGQLYFRDGAPVAFCDGDTCFVRDKNDKENEKEADYLS